MGDGNDYRRMIEAIREDYPDLSNKQVTKVVDVIDACYKLSKAVGNSSVSREAVKAIVANVKSLISVSMIGD